MMMVVGGLQDIVTQRLEEEGKQSPLRVWVR